MHYYYVDYLIDIRRMRVCVPMDESFDSSYLEYTRCWLCCVPLTSAGWQLNSNKTEKNRAIKKWRRQHEKSKWIRRRKKNFVFIYITVGRLKNKSLNSFNGSLLFFIIETLSVCSLFLFLLARRDIYIYIVVAVWWYLCLFYHCSR